MSGVSGERATPLDDLAVDLQALRAAAGSPSYADLVQRIAMLRRERGVPDALARPARTTVYDAFRTGRRRLDVALLADIVQVLGVPGEEVPSWTDRARAALADREGPAVSVSAAPPQPAPPLEGAASRPARGRGFVAGLVTACLLVNLLGRVLVETLHLPLHLDMVGTAVSAVVLGPWWGVVVGGGTNLAGTAISGSMSLPFAAVNIVGALTWGYGVRRWGMGRSVPRFFLLNVLVAAACTLTAAPIVVWLYDGATTNASAEVTATVLGYGSSLVVAVLSSNLLSSLADKMIAGFVALAAAEALLGQRQAGPLRLAEVTED